MRKFQFLRKNVLEPHGFTLIEIMASAAILGIIAIAILPAFSSLVNRAKLSSYRIACATIVKAKMQEYISGAGSTYTTSTLGKNVLAGFPYTKYRYQNIANSCSDPATNPPGTPGFRESMLTNTVLSNTAATENPIVAGKYLFREQLKGFQLWVNLRGYNPRTVGGPSRWCPPTSGANQYQFLRVGDAIEITVTGMIRTAPTTTNGGRDGKDFGGVTDIDANTPNPKLTCSLSQLVYPPKQLYRYTLMNDGRVVNNQLNEPVVSGITQGGNITESSATHFRNIWSTVPAAGRISDPGLSNIISFAASPNNNRVYVLKPGEISVYTNCTDQQVQMTDSNNIVQTFNGIPNCSTAAADKKYYPFYANINNIAVDFSDGGGNGDNIYGLMGTTGTLSLVKQAMPAALPASGTTLNFSSVSEYSINSHFRIRSIFIVPVIPNTGARASSLFFSDNACYQGPTADLTSPFCITIHNAGDAQFNQPLSDALVQAIGFSN